MAHLKEAYAVMGRKVVNSAANSLPHDSRRRMMFEGIEQAMVDEDIGLPTMSDGMSSTGSIWDELDPVRGQQHSVPPQDPGPNSPTMTVSSNGQSMLSEQEVARRRLKEIQEELMFTLASRAGGYVSLNDLKRDFSIDTGFIPDRVAQDYGFNSFEDFVNDDQMKTVVKVEIVDDQPVYVPRDCSRFRHIRDEQIYSNETTVKKEEADDWEKMARALLPQNQERYIHGKKVILRILHELGGETKHILWVRIQEQYKRETGKELSGNELRSMFQRDKAIKILTKLFQSEVEVTDAEQAQGHFYVKLKKPYDEILRCFDEVLHAQREAFAKFKNKRRYNNNNTFGQPQRKLTLEERFPPVATGLPTSIDQSVYMEQSTSQRIAMESLPNNNAQQENDNVDDETGLPNTNNNTKVKFGLPVDIKKPKMGDRSDSPLPAEPTARKQRFNWDATTLPSFEGERESNGNVNAPTAKATDTTTSSNNSPNGTSANNNNNNKKQQYTTRTADGNYTDSEAEADDEDDNASEVTIMDADEIAAVAGGGTSANSKQQKKPPLHIPAPPAFNPNRQTPVAVGEQPIVANKPVGHQVTIQNYIKQQMEMKSAGDPMQNVRKTRVNVAPQRQINALRDDDDDMETGLPRVPSMMPQRPSAAPINNNRASGMAQQQQPFMSSGSTSAPINNNCGSRMAQQQQQSFMSSGSTTRVFNPGPFAASATEMLSSSRGGMSEPVNGFALMDHVDDLRLMANRLGCSHETRHDEGTFAFRRDDKLLIFTEFITEFNESKVRGSWHKDGHIYQERYFPKVDWPMFYATIRGLLSEIYGG